MFKYNHMVKKVHNAYRAVSLIRFQNILQKGADIVILVWGGNRDRKRWSAYLRSQKLQ